MKPAVLTLLLLAFLAANLPFIVERRLLVLPLRVTPKPFYWRLIELFLLYGLLGGLAYALEANVSPPHKQGWEFYAITACLFLVFAFPGFVYRYLWKRS